MFKSELSTCPVCGGSMEKGFTGTLGLGWIAPEKTKQFAFMGIPLYKVGLLKQYLPSKATYHLSYVCQGCKINTVDYSEMYSRQEINELAEPFLEYQ